MAKKVKKEENYKIYKLPISKFIDTRFRDYSIYVLQSRGIPSFYDALTPIQRYILMNTPTNFTKTLAVVGRCIESGYHHGDSSLHKSIAKLARTFGAAKQLLEGYGFFGTEVSPEPAAARYTFVKLSPSINDILKKYKHLINKDEDGAYKPLGLDIPLGLLTLIIGISVGYKTIVLPRKLEDIQDYLNGKKKTIKPYFENFDGSIKKYDDNSWLITSNITVKDNRISIKGLPPIMKYSSVIKRLDNLFMNYNNTVKILNNSNTKVNIDIDYTGKSTEQFNNIINFIRKCFSIIVREHLIFVKDDHVLTYNTIEEYLDDYQWQKKRIKYYDIKYLKELNEADLKFNIAKKEFITFILQKRRTYEELDEFLSNYSDIKTRLENITARKFTASELENVKLKIKELQSELKIKEKQLDDAYNDFTNTTDPTILKSVKSKASVSVNLFESNDVDEVDGVYVWNGIDPYEEKEEIEEEIEE